MVEVRRIRAPEVPFARFVIALFTLLVLGGIYYVVGGPIPYFIQWSGPVGTAFEGRYEVVSAAGSASGGEKRFSSTYPHTVTVWGPRWQGVVASAQNGSEANALNTIMVRRVAIVCTEAYQWGTSAEAVCSAR